MKKSEKGNKNIFNSISDKLKRASDYPDDSVKIILDGAKDDLEYIKERYYNGLKFMMLCISLILLLLVALATSYLYIKDLEKSYQELSTFSSKNDSIKSELIDLYQKKDTIRMVRDGKKLEYFDLVMENSRLEDSLSRVKGQLNLAIDAYDLKFNRYKKNGEMYISVKSLYIDKIINEINEKDSIK